MPLLAAPRKILNGLKIYDFFNRKPVKLESHLNSLESVNVPVLIANFEPTENAQFSPIPLFVNFAEANPGSSFRQGWASCGKGGWALRKLSRAKLRKCQRKSFIFFADIRALCGASGFVGETETDALGFFRARPPTRRNRVAGQQSWCDNEPSFDVLHSGSCRERGFYGFAG